MLDDRLQIRPVHVLHHDEVGVVADADVEHLDAVRVGEVRAGARLVQEHPDELLLLGKVREHALDRDDLLEPLEARALGSIHLGHAARGDALDDAITLLLLCHRVEGLRLLARVWFWPSDGQGEHPAQPCRLPPREECAPMREKPDALARRGAEPDIQAKSFGVFGLAFRKIWV